MADGQVQAAAQARTQHHVAALPVNPGEDRDFLHQQLSDFGSFTGDREKWYTLTREYTQLLENNEEETKFNIHDDSWDC
jgi:hypothetical protein